MKINIEIKESNSGQDGVYKFLKNISKKLTTKEVSEELDITRENAARNLSKLEERGSIDSAKRKVDNGNKGGREYVYVWWVNQAD